MAIYARTAVPSAVRLMRVVHSHSNGVGAFFDKRSDVDLEWCVSISVTACMLTVDIYLAIMIPEKKSSKR